MTSLLTSLALTPLLMPGWLDPQRIIESAGPYALWVVALIIFAECGLFSILPGDSLLFTVGMFIAGGLAGGEAAIVYGTKTQTLVFACLVLTTAAILGNLSGYYLGRVIGPPLFKGHKGFMGKVFDPRYVELTYEFFDKYGPKALVLARFVPFVRTFVTLVAGIGRMPIGRFIFWTAIGGALWVCGVTTLGFFLGQIPFVKNNLEIMILLIVAISLIPMIVEYVLAKRRESAEPVA